MAQVTTGLRALLSHPLVYSAFQRLVGADGTWRRVAQDHVRPRPGERILDVGCGPGDMLEQLPGVDYTGIDLSADYIAEAQRRHGGRGRFIASDAAALRSLALPAFDTAIAIGLLHHLDDAPARGLFADVAPLLGPEGRMIVVEPCYDPSQSALARRLIARDRGQNARTVQGYLDLVNGAFAQAKPVLVHDMLRIPWTMVVITLTGPRGAA